MNRDFEFLLNAFEQASQADKPAKLGYAEKRRQLFEYVKLLHKLADESYEAGLLAGRGQREEVVKKDERYYREDGSLKWTSAANVAHLILQLQTLDPEMKVSTVTFIDLREGRKARAYGMSLSRERWDESGWLNFKLPGPECLAIWANPREEINGLSAASERLAGRAEGLDWDDKEKAVIASMMSKMELSEMAVLRYALRIAQLVQSGHSELREIYPKSKLAESERLRAGREK